MSANTWWSLSTCSSRLSNASERCISPGPCALHSQRSYAIYLLHASWYVLMYGILFYSKQHTEDIIFFYMICDNLLCCHITAVQFVITFSDVSYHHVMYYKELFHNMLLYVIPSYCILYYMWLRVANYFGYLDISKCGWRLRTVTSHKWIRLDQT